MADCPKCGRQLTAAGCIKCGAINDRSKWYALAEDADAEERKQAKPASKGPRKAATNAKRNDWYAAAGEAVPEDRPEDDRVNAKVAGDVPLSKDSADWAEVSRGRKDPPFMIIGGIVGFIAIVGGLFWYANRGGEQEVAQDQPLANLPTKNIQIDHSYGFKIDPPEGFKQVQLTGVLEHDMPDFAKGVHGETTTLVQYRDAASGIDAYYFGEARNDTNLDAYAQKMTSDLGKLTPLSAVPEGMKKYPTKGSLIDMGQRKALVYIASAKPDRYLMVWILAPATNFQALQPKVESAARAFTLFEPDGPHPGKQFAPQGNDDGE
ncbi:MAG: hypothetical protein JST54_07830 [Deltaproteobacteria bacterium]|nr:hypothetical protein [Deltaproteobacteria bacterium]